MDKKTLGFIALAVIAGYMLSPVIGKIPLVNKLPKIGGAA